MRHRRNLILGGIALALLSTSALGGQVHAQAGTLQPVSGWSSTSVPNKGDASYCAVARRFDGNVILTIARNKRQETSVALDFDAAQFEKENRFNISLDPGAGAQRSMTVKPASDKAFVLKLGQDEAFYNALLKTGFLRTEIGEKGYNFNLSDISAGKENLTTCLSQIGIPDMPQQAAVSAPAAPDPKLEELSRRLARLESENRQLKNDQVLKGGMTPELPLERVALKPLNDLVEVAPAPAPKPATVPQAAPSFAAAAPAAGSSVAKVDPSVIAGMAEENRKLKEMLEAKSAAPDTGAQFAALNDRLQKLEKENKSLAKKLENSETQLALASSGPEISTEDSRTIQQLRKENDRLVASLAALQTAAGDETDSSSPAVSKETERKLSILENQNRVLTERLDTLLGQNGDYARQVARYEAQVAELERKLAQPQEPQGPDYAAMVEALKEEIIAVQTENIALREARSRPDPAVEREVAKLKAENDLLNKEILQAQSRIFELKEQKARPDPKLEGEIAALKAENELLNKEIVQAQSRIFDLQNEKSRPDPKLEGEISALKTENEMLGQQLAQLQSENIELKVKTQGPDYAAMVDSLKQQLSASEAENAALRETHTMTDPELEGAIAALKTENELLNLELARQSELARSEYEDKLEAMKTQNEKLQERLAGYLGGQGSLVALRNEMEGIKAQKDELSVTMADLKAQTEKLAALEKEAAAKEEESLALQARLAELEQENASLKQASVDEKAASAGKALTLAEYEDKLENLTLENENLRAELENLQTAQAEAADESARDEDGADIVALEARIKSLDEENAALKKELGMAQIALISGKKAPGDDVSAELEKALSQIPGQGEALSETASGDARLALDITEGGEKTQSSSDAVSLDEPLPAARLADAAIADEDTESVESAESADDTQDVVELAAVEAVPAQEPAAVKAVRAPVPTSKPAHMAVAKARPAAASAPVELAETAVPAANSGNAPQGRDMAESMDPESLAAIEPAAGDDIVDSERLLAIQEQQAREAGLSEAQRQEMAMAQEVGQGRSVPSAAAQGLAADDRETPGALGGDPAIDAASIETEILVDPETVTGDTPQVLARVSDTGGHPEGTSDELVPDVVVNEGLPSSEPLPAASAPVKSVMAEKAKAAPREFTPALPIENILTAARIPVEGTVKMLADMSSPNFHAYQWQSKGGLFGSAQQKPIQSEGQFDQMVQDYLSQTERRCQGDFAIDPSSTQESGGTRIDTYEIACVGGGVDSSASLLFFQQGGTFTVVAHESPTESMESAMDYRDRLVASLRRS